MNVKELLQALGDIDDKYLIEQYNPIKIKNETKRKNNIRKTNFKRKEVIVMNRKIWGFAAIAVLVIASLLIGIINNNSKSGTEIVNLEQIANPLTEVSSVEEMEKYLGFEVPLLDKEVETYIVIGDGDYATQARIIYKDGTSFNMAKGSEDVSGIYGGELEKEEEINGISVKFYIYENTRYVIWENNGFSYSLENDNGEISTDDINILLF